MPIVDGPLCIMAVHLVKNTKCLNKATYCALLLGVTGFIPRILGRMFITRREEFGLTVLGSPAPCPCANSDKCLVARLRLAFNELLEHDEINSLWLFKFPTNLGCADGDMPFASVSERFSTSATLLNTEYYSKLSVSPKAHLPFCAEVFSILLPVSSSITTTLVACSLKRLARPWKCGLKF